MPYLYTLNKTRKTDISDFDFDFVDKIDKVEAGQRIIELGKEIDTLQEYLYASASHSVLIVLQGMDTAGKDGTISHVFESVNPQGCSVASFKQPSPLESAHDFLWRAHEPVPPKGMMTIFNRSYYEDVLVVRVHDLVPKDVWSKRYDDINRFETLLAQNNTIVLKFFLHISKDEQKERLLAREKDPSKAWKLSAADWHERNFWDKYTEAYQDVLRLTSTDTAPWYVVPANHKWYRNLAIASKIVDVLGKYKDDWERELQNIGEARKAELAKMRGSAPNNK